MHKDVNVALNALKESTAVLKQTADLIGMALNNLQNQLASNLALIEVIRATIVDNE
jgi:hypothetical protein